MTSVKDSNLLARQAIYDVYNDPERKENLVGAIKLYNAWGKNITQLQFSMDKLLLIIVKKFIDDVASQPIVVTYFVSKFEKVKKDGINGLDVLFNKILGVEKEGKNLRFLSAQEKKAKDSKLHKSGSVHEENHCVLRQKEAFENRKITKIGNDDMQNEKSSAITTLLSNIRAFIAHFFHWLFNKSEKKQA